RRPVRRPGSAQPAEREIEFLASARAHAELFLLPPSGVTQVLPSGKRKRPAVLRESGWPFSFRNDLYAVLMGEGIAIRRREDLRTFGIRGAVALTSLLQGLPVVLGEALQSGF